MTTQRLWMNVYRAGFYHRQGKANHTNLHSGDFFTTREAALACCEYDAGYITTVSFEMPVPAGATILANPPGSEPVALSVTRNNPLALMPWHTPPEPLPPILTAGVLCDITQPSLEPTDSLGMGYEEWKAHREAHPTPAAPNRTAALLRAFEEAI